LRKPGTTADSLEETVFDGINDGTQTIPWRGTLNGQLAPAGTYEMRISGTSQQGAHEKADQKLEFTVKQSYEPLEEELPPLGAADTVVASYDTRAPLWDFVKGAALGVAIGAFSATVLDNDKVLADDRSTWKAHWMLAGGVGVGAGLLSFSYRGKHLVRTEAVAENLKRRQMRAQFNLGVRQRNADRLDKTKLIIIRW
jgi:hypothetical protein